jgi:putative SOS response-associated peptidase YedK
MCTRYTPPEVLEVERLWNVTGRNPLRWWKEVVPLRPGPYIKPGGVLEVGQWGMIPSDSSTRIPSRKDGTRISTVNARDDRIASAWTYRTPWRLGQRCLIPAQSYVEPFWGHRNKNIWWKFSRADGQPWALAGIWSEWTDPQSGEVVPSYSMITQNCDAHPLLRLMHRPSLDPQTKQLLAVQDKRAVVPIERHNWDAWLHGTQEQARSLIALPALEVIDHGPEDDRAGVSLDLATGQAVGGGDSDQLF